MKPSRSSVTETILQGLKHPLFITLFSAFVASWVIPGIVGTSNVRAARAKARIDQALEVINTANSVDAHLHKMKTAFEAFEKDSLKASPEDYQKLREELRSRIYSVYSDFDGVAWSWVGTISYRALVLKLISPNEYETLKSLADKYAGNLVANCQEFDKPWSTYLLADASKPKPTTGAIMPGLDKPLRDLQSERDDLVRKMAEVFQ